ncbi:MAG: apolipoprotein N-acyltransferase [Bacteroidota bacterium]|nr:apolipoprotein N-acyltransferase [Bacteroidota bacterium]
MIRHLLLCLFSSALLILSWPPVGFPFLIFGAFIPIFFVVDNCSSKRWIFIYCMLVFLCWNAFVTYWIWHASAFGAIAAIIVNSLLMTGVFVLFHVVKSSFNDRRRWWALLVFWLSFEYIHFQWDLSWPWLTLGNVFSHFPEVVQWYEYTGVLGGSLWILLFNMVFFHSIKNKKKYTLAYVILLSIFLSNFLISERGDVQEIEVVVVQPNVDPYVEKFDGLTSEEQLKRFIEVAETKLDSSVDFLIGPETAIVNGLWQQNIDYSTEIKLLRQLLVKYPNLHIIIGATTYAVLDDDQKDKPWARKFRNSQDHYAVYNSALQLSLDDYSIYHKSKLVQGVEFMPFSSVLDRFDFLTIDLGGISGSLGTQQERVVFESPKAQLAPIICYESIFGQFTTEYVRNGASLFTIITNDGWWKDTPGYKQHLHYARLRAIENRRAIARSANTGISAFIDSKGHIIQSTKWDEQIAIRQTLKTNNTQTLYVRYGDYIGRLSSFVASMFILFTIVKRATNKR